MIPRITRIGESPEDCGYYMSFAELLRSQAALPEGSKAYTHKHAMNWLYDVAAELYRIFEKNESGIELHRNFLTLECICLTSDDIGRARAKLVSPRRINAPADPSEVKPEDFLGVNLSDFQQLGQTPHLVKSISSPKIRSDLHTITESGDEDFQLPAYISRGAFSEMSCCCPLYLAPEWYKDSRPFRRREADVYSFGIVMFEIFHYCTLQVYMRRAFGYTIPEACEVMKDGFCPIMSKDCPELMRQLICQCLRQCPSERPSIGQILKTLEQLISNSKLLSWKSLKSLMRPLKRRVTVRF